MRDNQRKCIRMFGSNMNKMDLEAVDVSHELGQSIQLCFYFTPVIISSPIICKSLHCRQRYSLRLISNRFLFRPSCLPNETLKVSYFLFRHTRDLENPDSLIGCWLRGRRRLSITYCPLHQKGSCK